MTTITFYSYKGGVGRTLALYNMVHRLSELGKKICVLDFDLEAPGLAHKFAQQLKPGEVKAGIADYIYEFYVNGTLPQSIREYSLQLKFGKAGKPIHFIPAGNVDSREYWKKLSAINWYDLLYESGAGVRFFLDLKEKIKREFDPDFLLVDSRTGITEISAITLSLLADEVVVLAANNSENIDGARKIINSLSGKENTVLNKTPRIVFVLSRIPYFDYPDARGREQQLIEKVSANFDKSVIGEVCVIHSDRDLEMEEKVKIGYDKDEDNPKVATDYLNLFERLFKDKLDPVEIKRFNDVRMAEKYFRMAIDESRVPKKIEYISRAIDLSPRNTHYYGYRIFVHIAARNYESAMADCRTVLGINKFHSPAYVYMAQIFMDLKDYKSSLETLHEVLKIVPGTARMFDMMGRAEIKLNHTHLAVEYYNKAMEIDPGEAVLYNNRADAYRKMKKYESAFTDIFKALELDSSNPFFYQTLAEINAEINNDNEFYLNLEHSLRMASEQDGFDAITDYIKNGVIYKPYFEKERFRKLLDKYKILDRVIVQDEAKGSS